jgi:hypothetical protein
MLLITLFSALVVVLWVAKCLNILRTPAALAVPASTNASPSVEWD